MEDRIDQRARALPRIGRATPARGIELCDHLVGDLTVGRIEELENDLALVAEVVVDGADGDPGFRRDHRRRRLLEALTFEAVDRRLDQLFTGSTAASLLRLSRLRLVRFFRFARRRKSTHSGILDRLNAVSGKKVSVLVETRICRLPR